VRTVTVATDRFSELALLQARTLGRPDLALVVIAHPLAGLAGEVARERGRLAGREVRRLLGGRP
jgi:hypothetical protein